jgi:signal transduction histidine kinase
MEMKKVLVNSTGWTDLEKESFKSYLCDMAEEYECHIEVLEGVDSNMDISVETDDESVVYMIIQEGLV